MNTITLAWPALMILVLVAAGLGFAGHMIWSKVKLQSAQQAFKESGQRYLNGLIDYLPVQTALTTAQRLEISEIQKKYDLLTYRLSLYRALGGNWMQSMPPKKMAYTTE